MKKKNKIDYDKELMEILAKYFPDGLNIKSDKELRRQKKIEDRDKFIDSILNEKRG